jgi:hypothetical protein
LFISFITSVIAHHAADKKMTAKNKTNAMSKNLFLANDLFSAICVFIFPPAVYLVADKPKKEKHDSN